MTLQIKRVIYKIKQPNNQLYVSKKMYIKERFSHNKPINSDTLSASSTKVTPARQSIKTKNCQGYQSHTHTHNIHTFIQRVWQQLRQPKKSEIRKAKSNVKAYQNNHLAKQAER